MVTQETAEQLKEQINLNRDLCRFCSYLIGHLGKHEDTERYDNMFLDILEGTHQKEGNIAESTT